VEVTEQHMTRRGRILFRILVGEFDVEKENFEEIRVDCRMH
jgi:hypothetical protein